MDYLERMETLKERYEPRCLALLKQIAALCKEAGMYATEPVDMSADEYKWGMGVWASPAQGPTEREVDVAITLEEAQEYGDDEVPMGMSWSLTATSYGGEIVGELRPYNFTPQCWVDGGDDEAVEARFEFLETSNIADIPRLIKEAAS